jgi:hypothetical protein
VRRPLALQPELLNMQPAPPPGWVNTMEEFEKVEKKKKEASEDRPKWESGICSCCSDPLSCAIGTVAPCVLFGMPGQAPLPLAFKRLFQTHVKSPPIGGGTART